MGRNTLVERLGMHEDTHAWEAFTIKIKSFFLVEKHSYVIIII